MNCGIKKKDIILLAVILILGGALLLCIKMGISENKYVWVMENGTTLKVLGIDEEGTYSFETENGVNVIQISNGEVCMIEADCPDRLCVKQGMISEVSQTIICLPHKIVVEVKSTRD